MNTAVDARNDTHAQTISPWHSLTLQDRIRKDQNEGQLPLLSQPNSPPRAMQNNRHRMLKSKKDVLTTRLRHTK